MTQRVQCTVSIDALNGVITVLTKQGFTYPYSYLTNLTSDEITVMKHIPRGKNYRKDALSALGFSRYKSNKIIGGLAGKGVARIGRAS